MTQVSEPQIVPRKISPVLISGVVFVVVIAAYFGGRYMEREKFEAPQTKMQIALQAFRSGYDQTALSLLTPLANEGNPKAQYWLADIYENGLGVKMDIPMALGLLEKSAVQGFVPAERDLGTLYLKGNKTLPDFEKARAWLNKAAITGDGEAQRHLGHIFALGLGVPRDLSEAYGWYENAAVQGDGFAQHLRDDLATRMSPAEVTKGQQVAKDIAASVKPTKA
jgi:TPR repeat protein